MEPIEPPSTDALDTSEMDVPPPPVPEEPTRTWFPPPETEESPYVPFVYDDPQPTQAEAVRVAPVSARIQTTPHKSESNNWLFLAGAVVAGILGALLTVGVLAATGTFDEVDVAAAPPPTTVNAQPAAQDLETAPTQIINDLGAAVNPTAVAIKAVPSVVTITVFSSGIEDDDISGVGSGSGVVMSSDGFIITNHHVIDGGNTFSVEFEDGRVYEAELIGSDDLTDIAVLKIDATALTPTEFGSVDALSQGDPVVAIGNPLGQDGGASVSVGIISAFDRRVDFGAEGSLFGMIQTDAAINSGSSGGGLFDAEGRLIGITSAIGVSQAGPEGIGYAIPIELVDRITAEIIEMGDVIHPFLGVTVATYDEIAADGAITPAGAIINTVEGAVTAAREAGLESDDIVIGIGGREITSQTDLILAVRLYRVGDEVEFVVLRDGERESFLVVMGQRPADEGG
jgi:S1-C subfamily serine protease